MAYDATLPGEEQSVLCAHGSAHFMLDRNGDLYEHSDAWILTGLLLVPRVAAQTMGAVELAERTHAPRWLTLAMRDFLLDRKENVARPISYSENA